MIEVFECGRRNGELGVGMWNAEFRMRNVESNMPKHRQIP